MLYFGKVCTKIMRKMASTLYSIDREHGGNQQQKTLVNYSLTAVSVYPFLSPIGAGGVCASVGSFSSNQCRLRLWLWRSLRLLGMAEEACCCWVPGSSPSNWCRWGLWLPQWSLFCQSGTHQPVRYRVVTDAAGMVGKACCCCRVAETHELLSKLKKYSLICTLSYSTLNIKILNTV